MAVKVRAYIAEGEAVQVQFDHSRGLPHVVVPNNAPEWYRQLLQAQSAAMFSYLSILSTRINNELDLL